MNTYIITGTIGVAILRDKEGRVMALPIMLSQDFWDRVTEIANGKRK